MIEERFRKMAAQCWCDPRTSMIEMDYRLAEVFAKALQSVGDEKDKEIERLKAELEAIKKFHRTGWQKAREILLADEKPAPGYCINDDNETDGGPLCSGCLTGEPIKDNVDPA